MRTVTTPRCGPTSPSGSVDKHGGSTSPRMKRRHCRVHRRSDGNAKGGLMSRVQDKVTVVTGAGSGIGRALAVTLARRGARVAISDVDEEALAQTAERVNAVNG